MKLEVRVLVLAVVVALISIPAFAQGSLKIGVVDTDKAFKESIWGKKAMEELEGELEKWQEKGELLDKEIAALEEQLATQSSFMDDKEAEKKLRDEIGSKKLQGQALVQQGNAVLQEMRQKLCLTMARPSPTKHRSTIRTTSHQGCYTASSRLTWTS